MIPFTVSSANTNKNSEDWQSITNWPSTAINSTISSGSWNGLLSQRWRTNSASAYRRCMTDMRLLSRLLTDHGRVYRSPLRKGEKKTLIARWGGITLARRNKAILDDSIAPVWAGRSELEKRLLADTCELCGSREHVEVHHIRALKDLQRKGQDERPRWVQIMAARRRKTLITCRKCHNDIHAGRADGRRQLE